MKRGSAVLSAFLAALTVSAAAQQAPLAPSAADVRSSPLADAAARGDFAAVRELLDAGHTDANVPDRDGTPPLHWAVRAGDSDTAKRLLAAGAHADGTSRLGVTPLQIAIESADTALVRSLLAAGADASRFDRAGETPLMVAVREGHLAVAQLLLDHGADANAKTNAAEPPRFIPPSESPPGLSKGIGIIRAGWPEGRGKRFPAAGSKTPLLYAARGGDVELAKLLLARGANLELADGNGVTPLIEAIVNANVFRVSRAGRSGHLAVANTLLDSGAAVDAMDWYGETPLWAAVDLRNLELGTGDNAGGIRDDAYALVDRMLRAGANPNVRTKEFPHERRYVVGPIGSVAWVDLTGQTPFLRAAAAGDLKVMRLLLEHGADPNIATNAGTTPLMVAAGVNWAVDETFDEGPEALLEAVKLAHSLGNDVNAVNSMGVAAVHGAANRGANDVIEYLAANGARLDLADKQGRTPLDWAKGVFLATHPPAPKPDTIALLERLLEK